MLDSIPAVEDARALAEAIVNTIHEPFLVLDADLRVVAASRSFYETFQVDPEHTRGVLLYALGDGQWDISALRDLLETIIPERTAMDDFEVHHDFPGIGERTMLLNARMVRYEASPGRTILLAFTDVTARRIIEREKAELLKKTEDLLAQKRVLLQEMEHRVANSLQIIASILLLKARVVGSEESRQHLRDAHERVMSVAAVQAHLHATEGIEEIHVGDYLTKLCGSLATSMIGEATATTIEVAADDGTIGSADAVSLGLIVTELVINALKYAFPTNRTHARVVVRYKSQGDGWMLVVSDNGGGKVAPAGTAVSSGLGTVIVNALVKKLDADLDIASTSAGMTVSIRHPAASVLLPETA